MELSRESAQDYLIREWRSGAVRIGQQWFERDLIVGAEQIIDWNAVHAEALDASHLTAALALEPEIILIGTGQQTVFPRLELHAALAQRGIGLEVMTTPAACRTFNVLLTEQRRVVAALILGGEPSAR